MKKLIVANWKMHFNPHETELFIHKLNKIDMPSNIEAVLCPPFLDLQSAARAIDARKYKLGAQNAHHLDEGPYTGEVSAAQLRGLVDYAIIGHSERRAMGEKDSIIAEKMSAAVRNGIKPILCVGETLDDRHDGHSKTVVLDQLHSGLMNLTAEDMLSVTIAYEPIWALSDGHGNSTHARAEDVDFVFSAIRITLEKLFGEEVGNKVGLLYGGSADPEHCSIYLNIPGVSGLLIGGASLVAPKFAEIIEYASK